MNPEVRSLIDDTIELTGVAPPALLDRDAPVLTPAAVSSADDAPLYLVGLIGGKDVGKSSLVNALVGQTISEQSSHGPGTEDVIAYAHHAAVAELRSLLEREVPGQYRIIPHNVPELSRQVLVDLPDIDSHWQQHVALTRRMLRHLLFPLWIQSIEKYADLTPQRLLTQVAAGNDPANFVFCLNKADQIVSREGQAAAEELRADYAARLAKSLSLPQSPRVYMISAAQPQTLDLPALRTLLSNQKQNAEVKQSQALAGKRQDRSLLGWLQQQNLPERSDRAQRQLAEAGELLQARVGVPLMETLLPRIVSDPGYRLSIAEPAAHKRLSRWPIVNIVQTALLPLMSIIRQNVGRGGELDQPAVDLLVDNLRGVFALLYQSQPAIGELYQSRKLWEDLPSAQAVAALRSRLSVVADNQRRAAGAGHGPIFAPLRWLLTIGAAIWFPIAQPIVESMLEHTWTGMSRDFLLLAVQIFSAAYLIRSVGFLLIYFIALWALLRWATDRKVSRQIQQWSSLDADPAMSFTAQAVQWMDELLEPLSHNSKHALALTNRLAALTSC